MKQTFDYYEKNAKDFCALTINVDMHETQNTFLEYLNSGAHILDAGCGSGRDSLAFIKKGYKVTAMDASKQICVEAEKLLHQEVLNKRFDEIDFENTFDGVWACASLIHVPRLEIHDALEKIYNALKVDGVLYASFKYGETERYSNERFFNDYTEKSICDLFGKTKFEIEKIFVTQDLLPDRKELKWVNIIAIKRT